MSVGQGQQEAFMEFSWYQKDLKERDKETTPPVLKASQSWSKMSTNCIWFWSPELTLSSQDCWNV